MGYDDFEDATVDCMFCGREIFEDAERCPHCDQWQTDADNPRTSQPTWVVVTAIVVLATLLYSFTAPLW